MFQNGATQVADVVRMHDRDLSEATLTRDKVGSSMNCFRLRLFPLTWTRDRK